jgi:hypothetical protein
MLDTLEVEESLAFPLARRVVKIDRVRPAFAGSIAGALGGVAMAFATDALMARGVEGHPFLELIASPFRGLDQPVAIGVGIAVLAVAGAFVGGTFANVTRRLKKLIPLVIWTALISAALWILLDAFFVAKLPWLAAKLPFVAVLGGVEAFALVLSLHLPFRLRKASVEVEERDEELEDA